MQFLRGVHLNGLLMSHEKAISFRKRLEKKMKIVRSGIPTKKIVKIILGELP
jgi:hypothetical protein